MTAEETMTDKSIGELLDDAPGDDRADNALKARTEAYDQALDLDWMLNVTDSPKDEKEAKTENPVRALLNGSAKAAPAIGWDIARGATEVPMQTLGGVRDAAQSVLEFAEWAGSYLPSWGQGEMREKLVKDFELPNVPEAESATGQSWRSVAQFLSGFDVR
jgi:hypothetical protein